MKLSMIVCTRNRAYAIGPCLDSIAASLAHAGPVEAEIIVVDNGSTDDTSAVIRAWAASCPFPVQALNEPRKGVSRARNLAIRSARGDLLAFTDDDCRLSPDYVKDALRHDAADAGPVLRGGRIDLGDSTDLPMTIKTEPEPERWNKNADASNRNGLRMSIASCNMTIRRSDALKLGPLDERFGPGTRLPAAEDTDYIYRAYLAGMTVEYVPDMMVYHFHGRKQLSDGYKLWQGYTVGTGGLYLKLLFAAPDLGRQFYWDIKIAFRELVSGQNLFKPDIGFSYKHKVAYSLQGMARFLWIVLKAPFT